MINEAISSDVVKWEILILREVEARDSSFVKAYTSFDVFSKQQEVLVDRDASELFGDEISSFTPSDDSDLPF